jgi:hypothetical protein
LNLLFRYADPAGDVKDLGEWEEKNAADDREDAHQAHVPAVSSRKAYADTGKLPSEDRTHKTRRIGRRETGRRKAGLESGRESRLGAPA